MGLFQCLFSGCRLNQSDFSLPPPPAIHTGNRIDPGVNWQFDTSVDALDWLHPKNQLVPVDEGASMAMSSMSLARTLSANTCNARVSSFNQIEEEEGEKAE